MKIKMLTLMRTLLLMVGILLLLDGLWLMAQGKINFGTIVPSLIGMVFIVHGLFWQSLLKRLAGGHRYRVWQLLWLGFGLWLMSFIVFALRLQQVSHQPLTHEVTAVIVLGSGTVGDQPSATLARRLDTAAAYLQQQPDTPVVVSGGVGFGKTRSEADIMAAYLQRQHGIDAGRIWLEDAASSTEQNLALAQPILQSHGVNPHDPIAIVTSDFHTLRAAAIARHQGYEQVQMVASPTPVAIRYHAWFREYFAFISGWLLGEY